MTPLGHFEELPAEAWLAQMRELADDDETMVGIVPCQISVDGRVRNSVGWATAQQWVPHLGRNMNAEDIVREDDPAFIAALAAILACDVAADNTAAHGAIVGVY